MYTFRASKRQRRNTRKQIALDKSAARVRRYDAKTKAREKTGGAGVADRPSYWQRRKICRDYYSKCRKGRMDRIMARIRRVLGL